MTEFIGKAGKKLFARHIERYAPEDPLYEFYTDERGKQKRRKVKELLLSYQDQFTHIASSASSHLASPLGIRLSSVQSRFVHTISTKGFLFAAYVLDGHSLSDSYPLQGT